jgi:arabinofuranosyltransferase
MNQNQLKLLKVSLASIIVMIYAAWCFYFIRRTSFIAIDGQRYYSLFDDAMIIMRYAYNLAHGNGFVWNINEHVEGYTCLLQTLLMVPFHWIVDKRIAVLMVQLVSLFTVAGLGYLSYKWTMGMMGQRKGQKVSLYISVALTLTYYPLVYWSLMGMETGNLTLLTLWASIHVFNYFENNQDHFLYKSALFLGLAYWTRPDAILIAGLLLVFLMPDLLKHKKHNLMVKISFLYLFFPISQLLFRLYYYGEWLPNTYALKVKGIPLDLRIENGLIFMQDHLYYVGPLFLASLFFIKNKRALYSILLFLLLSIYQIWTGGDSWPPLWRMTTPAMPFLFSIFAVGLIKMILDTKPFFVRVVLASIGLYCVWHLSTPFHDEIIGKKSPYCSIPNRDNTNAAIAVNALTSEKATVAIIYAGVLPYFTDRYAIDLLGKCDPVIANRPPDLNSGMKGNLPNNLYLVGHIKYNFLDSIVGRKPTFVERFLWGSQDFTDWGNEHYEKVNYKGIDIFLRKEDQGVLWNIEKRIP